VVQTYQIARSLVEAGGGMAVVDPFTAASGRGRLQSRPWAPAIPDPALSVDAGPRAAVARRPATWPTASPAPRARLLE
jgi:hypothetical protein